MEEKSKKEVKVSKIIKPAVVITLKFVARTLENLAETVRDVINELEKSSEH